MYSSGNIDVENWVHLFESRCIIFNWWLFELFEDFILNSKITRCGTRIIMTCVL